MHLITAVSHVVWWLALLRIRQTQGANLVLGSGVTCWEFSFLSFFSPKVNIRLVA